VHDFFQHRPEFGVGSLLEGEVSYQDQALRIGDNLAVSMANRVETDPTRILLAEHTVDILDDIQKAYEPDVMIFDLPSVLVNDDTRAFLKNVDCALIISRANVTRYGQLDVCEREISEHTNVLGVVLNACRSAGGMAD
jgi:Mrp family chromosome partitioning ATPase